MLIKMTSRNIATDEEGRLASVTVGRVYEVLEITAYMYRILNDDNEPSLYETDSFDIVDPSEPDFWHVEYDEGDRWAGPASWGVGFFEDVFDDDPRAVAQFSRDLRMHYPWTWKERYGSPELAD